jgi:hypothetical protein
MMPLPCSCFSGAECPFVAFKRQAPGFSEVSVRCPMGVALVLR